MVLHPLPQPLHVMILAGILVPLRAFVIGALGAAIAWAWYNDYRWVSLVAPLAIVAVGWVISEIGVSLLPKYPVSAVRLMPWRILAPAAVAAFAAGAAIIATIELTLPEEPAPAPPVPTDLKETVAALSAAITGFLGAAFVDWAGDGNDSRIADWIKSTFHEKYKDKFQPGSDGANYVYSDNVIDGWGPAAREKRANEIAKAMK